MKKSPYSNKLRGLRCLIQGETTVPFKPACTKWEAAGGPSQVNVGKRTKKISPFTANVEMDQFRDIRSVRAPQRP